MKQKLISLFFLVLTSANLLGGDFMAEAEKDAFIDRYEHSQNVILGCITLTSRDEKRMNLVKNLTVVCPLKGQRKINDKLILLTHIDEGKLEHFLGDERSRLVGSLVVVCYDGNSSDVEVQPGDVWSYEKIQNLLLITGKIQNR